MLDDRDKIQNSKGEAWHGEEVHRCNDLSMIAQECRPEWPEVVRGWTMRIARYSARRNIKAELEKLTMDSRSSPRRILGYWLMDEILKLGIDFGSAGILCA
jgi:hypothetical protein